MRKRLLLLIPLALLGTGLVYALAAWGLREYQMRPLTGSLTVTDPALANGMHDYPAGNFDVQVYSTGSTPATQGTRLLITSRKDPTLRWLWHTEKGRAFVAAAQGQETVREQRGSYTISDRLARTCTGQTLDAVTAQGDTVTLSGKLDCGGGAGNTGGGAGNTGGGSIGYTLTFQPASENQLGFRLSFSDPSLNRAYLTYASDSDEHFFGFGEQFSYFDHKGHRVPIWVSEQGIGRGLQPLTALADLAAGAGGNDYTTYAAVPQYITSRLSSLFLENTGYSVFDLRQPDQVQISTFGSTLKGRILYGANPEALITEYTAWAGRMRPLPNWILDGAVVGMQGGTDKVRQVYEKLKAQGAPVAAFWLQDWVGQRTTSFGKQLWWNWELDSQRYPGWDALVGDLKRDNVRVMLYASPFLADVSSLKPNLRRDLFKEARDGGYLVRRADGSPYLVQNTDFSAGLVDLTNPTARAWYQSVLKQEMVDIGASGWMADFGEALPYDSVLDGAVRGKDFHNLYPVAWAQLNRELVDALPNGADYVFFNRSAFSQSPAYATLFWEGDQLVSWDANDGIKSAVTGLLSGGISGFSLNHSDIGGYTGINNPLAHVSRSKELLLRWMDLSAFTTLYRTHEGNLPDQNAQFYSDDESLAHFVQMAKVYQAWAPIRKRLVAEAARTGVPVARHLFINYPDDLAVYGLSYQEYLLGPDILVAPVLDPGQTTVRVYLPAGNWIHLWTGKPYRSPYNGQWVTVPAPIGQPGVFYKENTTDGDNINRYFRQAGLIK